MNGILVVDKPEGFTSFDVVAKLRGICETRKIGHGGTLDPMATGVLPVFIGGAAKAVDLAPNQDKAYDAELLFGLRTDTGDITGTVLERSETSVEVELLRAVLPRFEGPQQQMPPMYSAVKIDGKPLYKYAREGKQVQRKTRKITIHALELVGQVGENRFSLHVDCSKGTYIRTLCEDIGGALGVPATLSGLRRTRFGRFGLQQAHTLEKIQHAKDNGQLESLLLPVGELFHELPAITVDENQRKRLINGAPLYGLAYAPGRYRAIGEGGFIGLACACEDGTVRVEKLFGL